MQSTQEIIQIFKRKLKEGSLRQEDSATFFDSLYANGSMGRLDNELHVDGLLADFESQLHLDVHRFPPQGMISKSRLQPNRDDHQPWLTLVKDDYDHDFYVDPKSILRQFFSCELLTEDLVKKIEQAFDDHELDKQWVVLSQEIKDCGVPDQEIHSLYQDLIRPYDLPPLLAVERGMERLGIQYALAKRIHATTAYRPVGFGETPEGVEFSSSDIELVFIDKNSVAHSIHDLGSGVRAVLPAIVALSTAEVGLLSIEEPECHVHPKLQAELGDLLIQRIGWTYYDGPMDGYQYQERWNSKHRRNSNTLVETHSEHLILRILRRIRETTEGETEDWPEALRVACPDGIRPEDVAVLYVQPGDNGSEVIKMPVTPDGDFSKPWPGGFFAERDKELF